MGGGLGNKGFSFQFIIIHMPFYFCTYSRCLFHRKPRIFRNFFCTWRNQEILIEFGEIFKNFLFDNFMYILNNRQIKWIMYLKYIKYKLYISTYIFSVLKY